MYKGGLWAMTAILLRRLLKQPKLYLVLLLIGSVLDGDSGGARQLFADYQVRVNGFGLFACTTSYSFLLLWMTIGFLVLISDIPFFTPMEQFTCVRLSAQTAMAARAIYALILSIGYAVLMWLMSTVIAGGTLMAPSSWDKALNTMSLGQPVGNVLIHAPRVIISQLSPLLAWTKALVSMIAVLWAVGLTALFLSTIMPKKFVLCLIGILSTLDFAINYMGMRAFLYYISPFSWCRLEYQLTASQGTGRPGELYCWIAPCLLITINLFLILFISTWPKNISRCLNHLEE